MSLLSTHRSSADGESEGDPWAAAARGRNGRKPAPPVPGRRKSLRRRMVLGVPIDSCSTPEAVRTVERWVDERRGSVAMYVNAHLRNLASDDPELAKVLHGASMSYADGISIVWASKVLGHRLPHRIALTYAIDDFAANWGQRGFSVFLLGGEPGCADAAARRLLLRRPGLRIAGIRHGYFTDSESPAIVEAINASGADIVLVGLGNPRQEMWVAEHAASLQVGAILTCGGLFDWISGRRRRAPRWVGKVGLEWLYRLILEPRRLFKRYIIGNPRFVFAMLREKRELMRAGITTQNVRPAEVPAPRADPTPVASKAAQIR